MVVCVSYVCSKNSIYSIFSALFHMPMYEWEFGKWICFFRLCQHTNSCLTLSYVFCFTPCESQVNQPFVTKGKGGFVWGQMVSVVAMQKLYLWVEYLTYQGLKPTDLGCGTRKTTPCWAVLVWSRENNLIENHSLVQNSFSLSGLYLVAGGGHKPTWTKLNASLSLSLNKSQAGTHAVS